MDKYDLLISDVIKKTQEGTIKWSSVPIDRYAGYIFQSPFVYQVFMSKYPKEGHTYTLVFVKKKIPSHNEDFEMYVEKHFVELLIIDEGVLIVTLDDSYVSESDIRTLALEIEDKNQAAKNLFKGFE